jgi:antitoxin (DNA-binding transcriptional repressor) of toxin-antitoxin stability system
LSGGKPIYLTKHNFPVSSIVPRKIKPKHAYYAVGIRMSDSSFVPPKRLVPFLSVVGSQ